MRLVRVLVIEDEDDKRDEISAEVLDFFGAEVAFDYSKTFGDATQKILKKSYDLIVADLLMPRRKNETPVDVSEEIIDHLSNSDLNRLTTVVAISRFDDIVAQRQSIFARSGIFLIKYADETEWKSCLRICMQRANFQTVYDFVIVCALELERSAFEGVKQPNFEYGGLVTGHGLDVREFKIGDLRGACVLQQRMGLVDASITATRALDAFNPRLICMAGICGGLSSEAPLGAVLVSDITWEHQAGKWVGTDFEVRSYQERLDVTTRTVLSQMIERDRTLSGLASRPFEVPVPAVGAFIRPTVSGSAVIASSEYRAIIERQHGKVAGIDMEVFGVHRAAALHGPGIICFAAKTVVDHATEAKSNDLQLAGAILSARFVVKAIDEIFRAQQL
jgi:nucleoside phosphorylase/CheY-like chemotaxis protein